MWMRNAFLLLGILLAACRADVSSVEPASLPAGQTPSPSSTQFVTILPVDDNLRQLADEFRSVSATPGHFGGGPSNDDVDQWQGRKHQLMLELGSRLGDGDFNREQLVDLLGPADHVVTTGDPLMPTIASLPNFDTYAAADAFLVYEWRGTHDFLFFVLQGDLIVGSDWWYAYE